LKIIATTGHVLSRYEAVHHLLTTANQPQTRAAAETGLCFQRFQSKMLRAVAGELETAAQAGSIWRQQAANLLSTNKEQPIWGWASPETISLLDFWAECDPAIHFLLVYDRPDRTIMRFLETGASSTEGPGQLLDDWLARNIRLLRARSRRSDRCLLVCAEAALAHPDALAALFRETYSLKLERPEALEPAQIALDQHFVPAMLASRPEVQALFQELQALADLPGADLAQDGPLPGEGKQFPVLRRQQAELEAERDQLVARLAAINDSLGALYSQDQRPREALAAFKSRNGELVDWLRLVQDELESYVAEHGVRAGQAPPVSPQPQTQPLPEEQTTDPEVAAFLGQLHDQFERLAGEDPDGLRDFLLQLARKRPDVVHYCLPADDFAVEAYLLWCVKHGAAEEEVLKRLREPLLRLLQELSGGPAFPDSGPDYSRILHAIWLSRPDLRQHFDTRKAKGRAKLKQWLLRSGAAEYGLVAPGAAR